MIKQQLKYLPLINLRLSPRSAERRPGKRYGDDSNFLPGCNLILRCRDNTMCVRDPHELRVFKNRFRFVERILATHR